MLHAFGVGMLMVTTLFQGSEQREIFLGPYYSTHLLYQDTADAMGRWNVGGEMGIANIIPHVGFKIRGTRLRYEAPPEQGPYVYEYIPISFCTSFDLLPFWAVSWLQFTAETGLGVYWWRGLYNDQVIELPTGRMDERDLGFIGGATIQIRPKSFIGIEYAMRYHYLTSANIMKYGFYDKDEKIWEHGVGVKLILEK